MKAEPFVTPADCLANDAVPEITVCIINDMPILRAGLRMLLEDSGMIVVGELSSRSQVLSSVIAQKADVYLLDLDLVGENSLDLLNEMVSMYGARVVVLTATASCEVHQRAVQAGARGIVLKEEAPEVLVKAVKQVDSGDLWIRRSLLTTLITRQVSRPFGNRKTFDPEAEKIASLTPRERHVVRLVAEGLNSKVIADRLGVSEFTVRNHLTSILDKLDLANKFELAVYSFRHSLVEQAGQAPM